MGEWLEKAERLNELHRQHVRDQQRKLMNAMVVGVAFVGLMFVAIIVNEDAALSGKYEDMDQYLYSLMPR